MLDYFSFDLVVVGEEGNVTPMKECMTYLDNSDCHGIGKSPRTKWASDDDRW